MSKSMTPYLN